MLAPDVIEILKAAGILIIAGPGAFLGGRYSLNGTRKRVAAIDASQHAMIKQVDRIEGKVDGLTEGMADVRERLARVEAHDDPVSHRR